MLALSPNFKFTFQLETYKIKGIIHILNPKFGFKLFLPVFIELNECQMIHLK